jgi:hypothetical protein
MFTSDGLRVEELSLDDWRDTVGAAGRHSVWSNNAPCATTSVGPVSERPTGAWRAEAAALQEWLHAAFLAERHGAGPLAATRKAGPATQRPTGLMDARPIYWLWLAGAALALLLQAA